MPTQDSSNKDSRTSSDPSLLAQDFSSIYLESLTAHFPNMNAGDQRGVLRYYTSLPEIPAQAIRPLFECVNVALGQDRDNGGRQKCDALALAVEIVKQHPAAACSFAFSAIQSAQQIYQGPVWAATLDLMECIAKSTTEPAHMKDLLKSAKTMAMYGQFPESLERAKELKATLEARIEALSMPASEAEQEQANAGKAAAFAAGLLGPASVAA